MSGAARWSLQHPLLSRPRPKRSRRPSRNREAKTPVRDSSLDFFFPTVSETRHDGSCDLTLPDAPEIDEVIPQHWCLDGEAAALEYLSDLTPSPNLEKEEHHEETWTDLGADEGDGEPPDGGDDDGDESGEGSPDDSDEVRGEPLDDDDSDEAGGDPPDDGDDDSDEAGQPPDDDDDDEAIGGPSDDDDDDDSDEAGGEHETAEEDPMRWRKLPAAGQQYDERKIRRVKVKASEEGVRRQLEEEGDAGIITVKRRNVSSLAAFLEKRAHMYMANVPKAVVEDLCTEDGDGSTADNNSINTDKNDFLAEFFSSAGDESLAENSLNKLDSSEVGFPGQVGSHKSDSCKVNSPKEKYSPHAGDSLLMLDCIVVDDSSPDTDCVTSVDFSSDTNSSPKAVFPATNTPAKCDFPSEGDYLPLSRGAAAGGTDNLTEPAGADLLGLDLMVSASERDERVRLRRHAAEDVDLTPLGNCVNELFGSTRTNRLLKDSGFDLRNGLGIETDLLGKQLNEEAETLSKLKDGEGKYGKLIDAIVTLRKPLTEDTVRVRPLSENRLPSRRPLIQGALTLKEPPSEGTIAFEKFMSEESCESFRKTVTEDSGSSKGSLTGKAGTLRTPSTEETSYTLRFSMTERTELAKQAMTQENSISLGKSVIRNTLNTPSGCTLKTESEVDNGKTINEGGTTIQMNFPLGEDIHDCNQKESRRDTLLTLNAHEYLTESPISLGNNGAKGKQSKRTPPPKPPRTFAEAHPSTGAVRINLTPACSHLASHKTPHKSEDEDEREVAEGPSLHDGDNQTSTSGRAEVATVKNNDIKEVNVVDHSEPLISPERDNASCKASSQTVDDLSDLHNPPIEGVARRDKLGSPKRQGRTNRLNYIKRRNKKLPACSPGTGALPKNLQKGKTQMPQKPPRPSLLARSSSALGRNQDTCPEHEGALKYYCAKCRMVICRECGTVAHQEHRVLDTSKAFAVLLTEAVTFLKHYTLLRSLHGTLADTYRKYLQGTPQNSENETIALWLRLEDEKVLQEIVQEAEEVVSCGVNLRMIRGRLKEWEERQHEWGDLVYLAHRRSFLASVTPASDKVYLRVGDWVMPTPWIQLSHLLQPYLEETLLTAGNVPQESPLARSASPKSTTSSPNRVRMGSGSKQQQFPNNARQVLLSNLIPYIIFNPDIRYFIQVSNHRDLDLTIVLVPAEDHYRDYLKRRLHFANMSPVAMRRNGFTPTLSSLVTVEKLLMMGGRHHTHLTVSYTTTGAPGTTVMGKVSFPGIAIAAEGHTGLAASKGAVKKGELVLDQDSNGRYILALAVQDLEYVPTLLLGRVVAGLEAFTYLIEAEDKRRSESSGFRNKILSTVRREEAMMYQVIFGMDL